MAILQFCPIPFLKGSGVCDFRVSEVRAENHSGMTVKKIILLIQTDEEYNRGLRDLFALDFYELKTALAMAQKSKFGENDRYNALLLQADPGPENFRGRTFELSNGYFTKNKKKYVWIRTTLDDSTAGQGALELETFARFVFCLEPVQTTYRAYND